MYKHDVFKTIVNYLTLTMCIKVTYHSVHKEIYIYIDKEIYISQLSSGCNKKLAPQAHERGHLSSTINSDQTKPYEYIW